MDSVSGRRRSFGGQILTVGMPAKPAAAKPGKQSKAAKKAEELARKQEEERLAALLEEERLQREQIEREEELKRLAEEKRLVSCLRSIFWASFHIRI